MSPKNEAKATDETRESESGRQAPQDNAQVVAGVQLFDDDAPEVQPKDSKRKGKPAGPGDPNVLATLDALFTAKAGGATKKAKYVGTNATVRSVLKRTAKMWEKDQAMKGITVKVGYITLEGTISPFAENNDQPVTVAYKIDSLTLPAAPATSETDQASAESPELANA